jgi:hypothetical protein
MTSSRGSIVLRRFTRIAAILGMAVALSCSRQAPPNVAIDNDDIGGVVNGPNGPEAGVWVIAETQDLPVRFIREVVTDDKGQFVVPDLPAGNYDVWVRGYGLVDSAKVQSAPGKVLSLTATPAPNDAAAAEYYPAIYWFSLLHVPAKEDFGAAAGKFPPQWDQQAFLNQMKNNGCVGCHQLGQKSTRTLPEAFASITPSAAAWQRRTMSGQAGQLMTAQLTSMGGMGYQLLADWTDGIKKGALPTMKPTRPQGAERNVVITLRDWADEKHYLHDLISSDKRNPTVNANGQLYGQTEYSTDNLPILDPVKNVATSFHAPVQDKNMPVSLGPGHAAFATPLQPSAYWGDEVIWDSHVNNHNAMMDGRGRVWLAAAVRGRENPAYCKKGSSLPSAKLFPLNEGNRQVAVWDPKTNDYKFIDTCFETHHPSFASDENNTLWTSGGGPVVGWVNTKMFDETGDVQKSQGWTALILDTNGNGKRDDYVEPDQPVDPKKDRRVVAGFYAVMPSPVDGSVWGTYRGNPGAVVRLVPGAHPPETALAEIYNVPAPGFGVRGGDIDKNGVVWVSLASGHLGSFDRRLCKAPLNGPKATGDHCPEGWKFYKYPGPGFAGIGDNSAESSYYSWVDQHNTLGLGEDVPISTGNLNDALIAFKDGQMVTMRVAYPMGYYAKGLDGRIDDPNTGWKGRGVWSSSGDRTPWLKEGGKGTKPFAIHFQMRPDPLAH